MMEPQEALGGQGSRVSDPWQAAVVVAVKEGQPVMETPVRRGATQSVQFRTGGAESTGPSFPILMMPEPMSACWGVEVEVAVVAVVVTRRARTRAAAAAVAAAVAVPGAR